MTSMHDLPLAQETLRLAQGLTTILTTVEEKYRISESIGDFVNNHISKLGAAIGLYAETLNRLSIKSRIELQNIWKESYGQLAVREAVDELLKVEDNWDSFLQGVDDNIDHSNGNESIQSSSTIGSIAPLKFPLLNVRTSSQVDLMEFMESAELQRNQAKLDAAEAKVILITFGSQSGALQWLEETEASYPMLTDSHRKVYEAFGLRQSVAKVWSITTMTYYAEQKCLGRSLHKMVKDDDPNQMGGDFIVASDGTMAFVYCSKTPPDRPKITTLLTYF